MTNEQVVETSVTVNDSPIQDYVHPGDHIPLTQVLLEPTQFSRYWKEGQTTCACTIYPGIKVLQLDLTED